MMWNCSLCFNATVIALFSRFILKVKGKEIKICTFSLIFEMGFLQVSLLLVLLENLCMSFLNF